MFIPHPTPLPTIPSHESTTPESTGSTEQTHTGEESSTTSTTSQPGPDVPPTVIPDSKGISCYECKGFEAVGSASAEHCLKIDKLTDNITRVPLGRDMAGQNCRVCTTTYKIPSQCKYFKIAEMK